MVAGQDSLFISPLSPTSFASLATPALAYAGNLWGWTPQIRVEHRFDLASQQTLTLQGGILDNLDWEPPSDPFYPLCAGRRTIRTARLCGAHCLVAACVWPPAYVCGRRLLWTAGLVLGTLRRRLGGMADWQIPIHRRVNLSGEFYRGRGIGGLGAGIGRAVLFDGKPGGGVHSDSWPGFSRRMEPTAASVDSQARTERGLWRG